MSIHKAPVVRQLNFSFVSGFFQGLSYEAGVDGCNKVITRRSPVHLVFRTLRQEEDCPGTRGVAKTSPFGVYLVFRRPAYDHVEEEFRMLMAVYRYGWR